ncbi:MAG: glycosyltransferase [Ilumatobacter sp.]|uniref:glycosyltransferase n=1 Tax=Ilumatobacter sp. TaxID=1967498 RepID=UPI003C7254C0
MRRTGPYDRIERATVIVPAHDEQDRIVSAMRSLCRAAERSSIPVDGVIVFDACLDATRSVAVQFAESETPMSWTFLEVSRRRASSSRGDGLAHVVDHFSGCVPFDRIAVLSTDADTVVPVDWIRDHVMRLDDGDDAVAGVVELDGDESDDLCVASWRSEYRTLFSSDGTHPHVHGANLAVRLDALVAAGGFGHQSRAEDIDVWNRLKNVPGVRLRSDQTSVVRTSARLDGRVVGGFATALQQFRTANQSTKV